MGVGVKASNDFQISDDDRVGGFSFHTVDEESFVVVSKPVVGFITAMCNVFYRSILWPILFSQPHQWR